MSRPPLKEVEPVEPVQINIYQCLKKRLTDDESLKNVSSFFIKSIKKMVLKIVLFIVTIFFFKSFSLSAI